MQQTLRTGLTAARLAHIKALISELKTELDYLVQLEADERTSLNAVAEARAPFVKEAAKAIDNYVDELAMPTDEIDSLREHYGDFDNMQTILGLLASLLEGVSDTTMLLGAICYEKSLIVRRYAELAILRGVPGMEKVYESLSRLWERSSSPKNKGKDANGGANPPVPGNEPTV